MFMYQERFIKRMVPLKSFKPNKIKVLPILSYLRLISTKPRKTKAKNEEKNTSKEKKKINSNKIEKYILKNYEYLNVKELIPPRLLRETRKVPDDLYLIDRNVASEISKTIAPYVLDPKKSVIESNPGLGYLTKELLEAGLPKIRLYESTNHFREDVVKLTDIYPGRVTLYDTDFFSIWKLSYQDRHDDGDRVKKLLDNIAEKEWYEEPSMTIIGNLTSSSFLRYLIMSQIFQFGIMTRGRLEMYVCIPPSIYSQLTAGPDQGYLFYLSSSVLFQVFFDHEILKKLPKTAFIPWYKTYKTSFPKGDYKDSDYLYLARIEFKKEMPVPQEKQQHLWYFVRFIMLSRSQRLIPCLEKWIPGCGARLIARSSDDNGDGFYKDLNIYTKVGQLTPVQILSLYKEFANMPEYLESTFIASMETTLLKMESNQAIEEQIRQSSKERRQP